MCSIHRQVEIIKLDTEPEERRVVEMQGSYEMGIVSHGNFGPVAQHRIPLQNLSTDHYLISSGNKYRLIRQWVVGPDGAKYYKEN